MTGTKRHGPVGVLLANIGTPKSPSVADVRAYLRAFLSDPLVLDMNPVARWLLVHLVIAPRRAPRSAEAYAKIWTDAGSPLLAHSEALAAALRTRFSGTACFELAMRYGEPSIEQAVRALRAQGCERLLLLPLYPQEAGATTGSTIARAREVVGETLEVVPPYFEHRKFIEALAALGRPVLADVAPDHVIISFHGLPWRQVLRGHGPTLVCHGTDVPCPPVSADNRHCYRAQCFATARALSAALRLDPARTTVGFQSRLGRIPWLGPSFDTTVRQRAAAGDRKLVVFSPAFAVDCLETLEEIALRARDDFRAHGGDQLRLVPALNATPAWVDAVQTLLVEAGLRPAEERP